MKKIWVLGAQPDGRRRLQPASLDALRGQFEGNSRISMPIPTSYAVVGKSYPLRDFVSCGTLDPIAVSERARLSLLPVVRDSVEFLPLMNIDNKAYYLLNVVNLIDCLDETESDIVHSKYNGDISAIHKYVFLEKQVPEYAIFKIPQWPREALVTQSFVDVVLESKLTGAMFRDPSKAFLSYVLRGVPPNEIAASRL